MPPTGDVHRRAAASAARGTATLGLDRDDAHVAAEPRREPAASPPPPAATSTVSASGTCAASSIADRPLAGHHLGLIEGCIQRPGLGRAGARGRGRSS